MNFEITQLEANKGNSGGKKKIAYMIYGILSKGQIVE